MTTFVLVHGGWSDSWYWNETVALLEKQGHTVHAVDMPSSGTDPAALGNLPDDAAVVRQAVEAAAEPVVLVGHSWGGMVITELAGHPLVAQSVYLSAFWPDRGQTVMDLLGGGPPPAFVGQPRPDGSVPVIDDVALAHELMCADLRADRVDEWYRHLLLTSGAAFGAPSTAPERRHPTAYIVLEQDRALPPAAQEAMALRADRVERMQASHGVMLSDPEGLANILVRITMVNDVRGGTTVNDLTTGLLDVKARTAEALRAVEADSGASVVLVAVVREFDSKADKGKTANDRDAVIELEQAGDSAKAAAEADTGLGDAAREAVLDAHLAICILKTTV